MRRSSWLFSKYFYGVRSRARYSLSRPYSDNIFPRPPEGNAHKTSTAASAADACSKKVSLCPVSRSLPFGGNLNLRPRGSGEDRSQERGILDICLDMIRKRVADICRMISRFVHATNVTKSTTNRKKYIANFQKTLGKATRIADSSLPAHSSSHTTLGSTEALKVRKK